jgi:hypothetical protein
MSPTLAIRQRPLEDGRCPSISHWPTTLREGRASTRLFCRLVVLGPVFVVMVSCTGGSGNEVPHEPRVFAAGDEFQNLRFVYPASWTARRYSEQSSFSTLIVYLSNQTMVAPCQGGACGLPVKRLEPAGVLAWWSEKGRPGWTFDKNAKGQPLVVGGRRSRLSIKPGCHELGGQVYESVVIERPDAADNWYEFDVCIRGPGVSQVETQVRALLDSVTFR